MAQVYGIGGVFIYSNDPKLLAEWYALHFGIEFAYDEKDGNFWMLFYTFAMQLIEISTTEIAQLYTLEVIPNPLIRVEVRGVARQLFQMQAFGRPSRKKVFDLAPAMDWRAVPNDHQLARASCAATPTGNPRRLQHYRGQDALASPIVHRGDAADGAIR